MKNEQGSFTSIDEYIAFCPEETRDILEQIRATIRVAAPDAFEKISYGVLKVRRGNWNK